MIEFQRRTAKLLMGNDWEQNVVDPYDHGRSRARLMREYFRRSAIWARRLDATLEWPFFDIAKHVDATIRPDENLARALATALSEKNLWPVVPETSMYALNWAALKDEANPVAFEFEDPFEPLVTMYLRGGGFTTEHGEMELSGSTVRRLTLEENEATAPMTSLDWKTLDDLDAVRR